MLNLKKNVEQKVQLMIFYPIKQICFQYYITGNKNIIFFK